MSLQWMRVVDLQIGTPGSGVRITESFRIQFEVTKTMTSRLNTATIKIYNLNPDNERRISGEFDEVVFNVGYAADGPLLIFRGTIKYVSSYMDGVDRITEINAADADADIRKGFVNVTLAAGTTRLQLLNKIVETLPTTKLGHVVVKDAKRLRGKVVCMSSHDLLQAFEKDANAHWSIQDGRLEIVAVDSTLPTEAIVIDARTGMLGAPEVDDEGVKVKCLLNPRIRCNGKVKLDNADIKLKVARARAKAPGAKKPTKAPKAKNLARLDPDGVYKVYQHIMKGDTRSNEWTSEVFGVGLEKTIPAGKGLT